MTDRFPGFDVLQRRHTLSWNDATRRAIDRRLAVHPGPRFFTAEEWAILLAVCARILPQPKTRPPVPIAAYIDDRMLSGATDGYRYARLPKQGEAWKTGLAALDADSRDRHGQGFASVPPADQDRLLQAMQAGELGGAAWRGMPPDLFFAKRVLHDVSSVYYAHPTAWNEIGWSGPASPRGYVRLDADRRDPWEAAEAYPGHEDEAYRENIHVV